MSEPKIALDLFGCQGGATAGYQRAGYQVVAVDLDKNALKYNPAEKTLVADALAILDWLNDGRAIPGPEGQMIGWDEISLRHASPPCQGYTRGNRGTARAEKWPKLIPDVRERLDVADIPYVIENVEDAGPEMKDPVGLCGCMFDLHTMDTDGVQIHLQRLRLFEANWELPIPRVCEGEGRARRQHPSQEWVAGAYGGARRDKHEAKYVRKGGYVPPEKDVVKRLLGVEHDMTWNGLFECIPPAYAEWIGRHALDLSA